MLSYLGVLNTALYRLSGVLSKTTCWLNVAGNVARLYTTFVLTRDLLLGVYVLIQLFLNVILLIQTIGSQKAKSPADA